MKYVLYLLFSVLFMACTERKLQQKMEPFPVEMLLYAERIRVDEIINPEQIVLKRQSILVTDSRNYDAMLYQYSLPEFKCIYEGGAKGQAEEEFQVYPRIWRTLTDKVYIGGYTEFSLKSFRMDSICHLSFEKKHELPISSDIPNDRHIVRDSLSIYNETDKLAIKKINLNTLHEMGQILFEPDDHPEKYYYKNSGIMIANDSLIIYAYKYKKQIDFYSVDSMKLCKRLVGDDITPRIVIGDLENSVVYYNELVAGKRYFYARGEGKKKECIIEVFDYSGHSIAKYTLDVMPNPFDVDEENRIIYGYNSEFFEDGFLKFTF